MSAPIVQAIPELDCIVNVRIPKVRIRALNDPDSFAATGLPPNLALNTTTGVITGKVKAAGTTTASVTATNTDGTSDPVEFVIVATDSGGGQGEGTGVTVYPAKFWGDPEEPIDYADLDAAGQPICSIDPGTIGTTQLATDAVATKLGWVGGPGALYKYEVPVSLTLNVSFETIALGIISAPGVRAGDPVSCGRVMLTDGTPYGVDPDSTKMKKIFVFAEALQNQIKIWLTNFGSAAGTVTIPKFATVSVRVFSFPTDV